VSRHDNVRRYLFQLFNSLGDDFFEEPAGQVKAPHEGVNLLDTGNPLGVPEDVNNSRMATA